MNKQQADLTGSAFLSPFKRMKKLKKVKVSSNVNITADHKPHKEDDWIR